MYVKSDEENYIRGLLILNGNLKKAFLKVKNSEPFVTLTIRALRGNN